MALPAQLNPSNPADATAPSAGDDAIRTHIQAICDILGIPASTNISAALFTVGASGLTAVHLQDAAANPSTTGYLQRNGIALRYWDGTHAQTLNGTLEFNATAVGNVGTGEDNLQTYTFPAGFFTTTGRVVEVVASGTFAANGDTKTLKLKFGAAGTVTLNSVTAAPNNRRWTARFFLFKTGTDTQFAVGEFVLDPGSTEPCFSGSFTETQANALTLKFTGESGTATNDNIVQNLLHVKLIV